MMRKSICGLIVLLLVLTCNIPSAFADVDEERLENSIGYQVKGYLSEETLIKGLQSKGPEELRTLGYTEDEIERIMNLSENVIIEEMMSCSDGELKKKGFTKQEINRFRILAGSNPSEAAKMVYSGVECIISVNPGAYYYTSSDNITHLTTVMTWKWKKEPLLKYKDIVALSTNSTEFVAISYVTQVNYYHSFGGSVAKTITQPTYTEQARTKTYCTFDMQTAIGGVGYAYSGKTSTYWNAQGKRALVAFAGNYGHTGFKNVIPTLSVGNGLSISFGPTDKVEYGPEESDTAQLK